MIDLPDRDVRPAALSARPATGDDLERLSDLHTEARELLSVRRGGAVLAAANHRGVLATEIMASFARAIDDPGRLVLAGTLGDAVVGYVVVAFGDPVVAARSTTVAVLEELFVEPGARRVGIGAALLEEAREAAARRGCSGIDGIALPGDRATKNFFEDHAMVARAIVVHGPVQS